MIFIENSIFNGYFTSLSAHTLFNLYCCQYLKYILIFTKTHLLFKFNCVYLLRDVIKTPKYWSYMERSIFLLIDHDRLCCKIQKSFFPVYI